MPVRSFVSPAVSLVLLLALVLFLFALPLRPTAWGGPRGQGPFETEPLPGAGWFARDARLGCESVARWRSPDRPLEAKAEALSAFHALLAAARYVVLWMVLRGLGGSDWLAALAVVASALPLAFDAPRHDQSEVALLLFVMLLALSTSPRVPWWVAVGAIPALFVVWANAHTSALVGLGWLLVLTVGRAIEWVDARRAGTERPAVGRLVVGLVLGAAACCLNPDGPRLFVDAVAVTKNPSMADLPGWRPVDFSKSAGMPWAYFATLATLFVAQLASPRVLSPTSLCVLLSFGFWPLVQQRGLAYWWLIVPWLIMPLLRGVVAQRGTIASPDKSSASGWARWWLPATILAVAVLNTQQAWWFYTGRPRSLKKVVAKDTPWRVGLELTATGEEAGRHLPELREVIRSAYPNGKNRGAILAGLEQGDFLAWVLDGDDTQPVMVYTRPETLNAGHWAEAMSALEGRSDWWETLGRHQVNLVVIDPGRWGKLAERLRGSSAWRTVQDDGPGGLLVTVRREPKLPAELDP